MESSSNIYRRIKDFINVTKRVGKVSYIISRGTNYQAKNLFAVSHHFTSDHMEPANSNFNTIVSRQTVAAAAAAEAEVSNNMDR